MEPLSDALIDQAMANFPDWSQTGDAIQRTYQFSDFVGSMRFVNEVAAAAERDQHHPDILIRWNKVTLTLSTHDAGGITEKDFDLARKCDEAAMRLGPPPKAPASPAGAPAKKKSR
ncbi:MAG: 4a-hydroxytetrahydrobiopterin dehydratase [Phycisphaerales bacterium]